MSCERTFPVNDPDTENPVYNIDIVFNCNYLALWQSDSVEELIHTIGVPRHQARDFATKLLELCDLEGV